MKLPGKLQRAVLGMAAEIRRLRGILDGEDWAFRAEAGPHGMQATWKHWAVKALALSFYDTLKSDPRAVNYLEMECGPIGDENEMLIVQVRRKRGKQPSELVTEQRAQLAEIAKLCDENTGTACAISREERLQRIHAIATRH